MHLPRGRSTDALIAFTTFCWLLALLTGWSGQAAIWFGFIPAEIVSGGWEANPLRAAASPITALFVHRGIIDLAFAMVLLLISGRFVEKSVGPIGLAAIYLGGALGSALARLVLTPGSVSVGIGASDAVFAVIGAYLMLFGIPQAINIGRTRSRVVQIAMLAGIWLAIQLAFSLAAGAFDLSLMIAGPLGGLAAGVALARPMLAWRYRNA